jgi:hypothetical protein
MGYGGTILIPRSPHGEFNEIQVKIFSDFEQCAQLCNSKLVCAINELGDQ